MVKKSPKGLVTPKYSLGVKSELVKRVKKNPKNDVIQ